MFCAYAMVESIGETSDEAIEMIMISIKLRNS